MSTSAVPDEVDTERCMSPREALSAARRRHNNQADESDRFDDLDADDWKENVEVTDVQEREWVLTEVEYYTVSEEREEFEFPLSKDIPENSPSDPFETDEITIYDSVSTGACSVCDGEGVSACETCGGDGEMDCPNPNCRGGEEYVDCECLNGEALDDCPECGGRGERYRNGHMRTCGECNGRGEVYKTHTLCNGTGERKKGSCNLCTNEPPIDKLGLVECTDCSPPEHTNTCENCEGEGTTYHGVRIERSYDSEVERTVEDGIPEEVFERHADCVTVDRYDADSVPAETVVSEDARSAEDFRVIERRLEGYDMNYSFDGEAFESTVIGDGVYRTIPKVSKTITFSSVFTGIGVFVLWLGGFVYLIESPRFESPLWLTANFWLGLPIAFVLYGALFVLLPGMEQYQVRTYDIGFSEY